MIDDEDTEHTEGRRYLHVRKKDERKQGYSSKTCEPSSKWKQITPDKRIDTHKKKKREDLNRKVLVLPSPTVSTKASPKIKPPKMEDSGEESVDNSEEEMQEKRQDGKSPSF
ncbi:hypothetical protein HMI55_004105 [Coelomomyces lativittatus]|nr:hypothetical protein HMI55_004105 [Coelomomyces lativittatus]